MPAPLAKADLLARTLAGVTSSGYQAVVVSRSHPFLLRAYKAEEEAFLSLRVYIWNCTHGGKSRAADEYRIQLTSVPVIRLGEQTLLLGWHEDYGVFVGFDIKKHEGQDSGSPSIQVKEQALLAAHTHAFSAYDRANGEIAVTFRPEFLVAYAANASRLHAQKGATREYVTLLSEVDNLSDRQIDAVKSPERREVISTIKRKYREADFRARVLTAYGHRCAMCGVQLDLVEAAHILPVAADTSTDETANGVALCVLHHDAFDQSLVSFNERFQIEVSSTALGDLKARTLLDGHKNFRANLKRAILLPADKRDYPSARFISRGREVRRWRP